MSTPAVIWAPYLGPGGSSTPRRGRLGDCGWTCGRGQGSHEGWCGALGLLPNPHAQPRPPGEATWRGAGVQPVWSDASGSGGSDPPSSLCCPPSRLGSGMGEAGLAGHTQGKAQSPPAPVHMERAGHQGPPAASSWAGDVSVSVLHLNPKASTCPHCPWPLGRLQGLVPGARLLHTRGAGVPSGPPVSGRCLPASSGSSSCMRLRDQAPRWAGGPYSRGSFSRILEAAA